LNGNKPSSEDYKELFNGLIKLKSVIHYTISFDSTMIATEDLIIGENRLYQVSDPVVLPVGVPIKILVTSSDVLHSWSIPNLGIKVDAVPGRINQFITEIKHPGRYFGQCSELCGTMHGFMPIVLQVVTVGEFEK
jgi:heme/copper-type cytochrome/quinol oxidase subunit 2